MTQATLAALGGLAFLALTVSVTVGGLTYAAFDRREQVEVRAVAAAFAALILAGVAPLIAHAPAIVAHVATLSH